MQNKKGFTIVEIMVALALITVAILCFLPLMLSSLKNVEIAGTVQKETLQEQSEIEKQLGLGAQDNQEAFITFHQTRNKDGISVQESLVVEGEYLTSSQEKLVTYVATQPRALSISPSVISEVCLPDTVITITSDFITFSMGDDSAFSFVEMKDGKESKVEGEGTKYVFSYAPLENPYSATLTIKDNSCLSIQKNTYKIYYGSSSVELKVTPPSLIAVGTAGAYIARTQGQDGHWVLGKGINTSSGAVIGNMGNQNLNDVIWTGTDYILGGDNGAWFYTQQAWQYKNANATVGSGLFQGGTAYVNDLHYATLSNEILATGHRYYRYFLKEYTKTYHQKIGDPALINFKDYSEIWDDPGYLTKGLSATEGFVGTTPVTVKVYTKSNALYTQFSNLSAEVKVGDFSSDAATITSNMKTGTESAFLLATKNNGVYILKPVKGFYWEKLEDVVNQLTLVTEDTYYYSIQNYKNGEVFQSKENLPSTTADKNNGVIPINGVKYDLTNNRDIQQFVAKGTYILTENKVGTFLTKTENIQAACAETISLSAQEKSVFVLGGETIQLSTVTPHTAVQVPKNTYSKWAGKKWNVQANNIDPIVITGNTSQDTQGKIAVLVDDTWRLTPLPTDVTAKTVITDIQYIGDRFYAVGYDGANGVVLSIAPKDLIEGKAWYNEINTETEKNAVKNKKLTAIAGWGVQ